MLLDKVILTCQQKIGQTRTINSVYHILQGKPSIQTIQDIHLFKLADYYGIYKKLSKTDYHLLIERLVAKQYLLANPQTNRYEVTNAGEQLIEGFPEQLSFHGYSYKQIDDVFIQRLLLLIQVWTNSNKQQFKFLPIVDDYKIERWIKLYYSKTKKTINKNLTILHGELTTILKTVHRQYAAIFVDQLTGYEHIGLTINQLSEKYNCSVHDITLINRYLLHVLLNKISINPDDFTILTELLEDLHSLGNLTASTKKTLNLVEQGKSLEEIAHVRQLRQNTIYDHIVEIALVDDNYPISNHVPIDFQVEIMNAITDNNLYQLKEIKESVNSKITYFQIRLTLTKLADYV